MTDIVERLRKRAMLERAAGNKQLAEDMEQSADEIARLRAALREINVGEGWAAQIARAALGEKP